MPNKKTRTNGARGKSPADIAQDAVIAERQVPTRARPARTQSKRDRQQDENRAVAVLMAHGFAFRQPPEGKRATVMFDGKRVASMRVVELVVPEDSALGEAFAKLEREQARASVKYGVKS